MPSRRCPHCKAISTYDITSAQVGQAGYGRLPFGQNLRIRLDRCRNEDCGRGTAVVTDGEESEVEVFPALEEEPDKLLPPDVATAFRQALKSLNEGIWDGCVVMCRRALEEATAELASSWPDEEKKAFESKVLYDRIEHLADQHVITPDLRAWAHEGRIAGKLGAHGTKRQKWNTERDAAEIVEFAKWFFRYVFILPKQLQQRKMEAEAKSDTTPPEHTDRADQETPQPAP